MRQINLSADELIEKLLALPKDLNLCLLDSCGVSHLNSHLLIAGINPFEIVEQSNNNPEKTLRILNEKTSKNKSAVILTISYDYGLKLNKIASRHQNSNEPDIFLALFDVLIIHDYNSRKTFLVGNQEKFDLTEELLSGDSISHQKSSDNSQISSNFTKQNYISAIEKIQELIRRGDTYQTNLTQQISTELPKDLSPEMIFQTLRKSHPAPFASFIRRKNDVVISASPERFLRVVNQTISTSPIKGTRPRGKTEKEDSNLRDELINSEKDRAENIMIVDLLRNDLGRICEFGSVKVQKLCDLEEHPSLFHLVSTISGRLKSNTNLSDILCATFPCGSITGAPKIRTMKIIDEIETVSRGLSMGAIGIADCGLRIADFMNKTPYSPLSILHYIDLSVAIRTMTIRKNKAIFNVGGGIVIDSVPENEYQETLTKAKALLNSINAENFS